MFEIFTSLFAEGVTFGNFMICSAVALFCGMIAAATAAYRTHTSTGFLTSLVLLPLIVETVILMVNGNVGTGVAVMGAFSLVRFRSVAGRAREIVCIFLVMTVGLACAAGYIYVALLLTVLVGMLMIVLVHLPFSKKHDFELRITVPESLHFYDAFDDVFEKYTTGHYLMTVKTSNMGSLYKLQYRIGLKNVAQAKEMIDALRCRNGNLEIALCEAAQGEEL